VTDTDTPLTYQRGIPPAEHMRRILEPMPWGWEIRFPLGTTVLLKRPHLHFLIPVATYGTITELHTNNIHAERGQTLHVAFIPDPALHLTVSDVYGLKAVHSARSGKTLIPPDAPVERIDTACSPNDLIPVLTLDQQNIPITLADMHDLITWLAWQTNATYERALYDHLLTLQPDHKPFIHTTLQTLRPKHKSDINYLDTVLSALAAHLTQPPQG